MEIPKADYLRLHDMNCAVCGNTKYCDLITHTGDLIAKVPGNPEMLSYGPNQIARCYCGGCGILYAV